jgi:hypothetical protein
VRRDKPDSDRDAGYTRQPHGPSDNYRLQDAHAIGDGDENPHVIGDAGAADRHEHVDRHGFSDHPPGGLHTPAWQMRDPWWRHRQRRS